MRPLLAAFAAGVASIVGVRLAATGMAGAVAAALIAVAIVFALGVHYRRNALKQADRAGDDLYYLGLLLTLVSLIYTLIALFLVDVGSSARRVETLIGNFGIALVSTVAGILGRILLQDAMPTSSAPTSPAGQARQLRQPASAREGDAFEETHADEPSEKALAQPTPLREDDAILMLRRDLREAVDAFAHFTRITLSHAEHVKTHTEQLIENFNERIAAVAERSLGETATIWRESAQIMQADEARLRAGIDKSVAAAFAHADAAWTALANKLATIATAASNRLDVNATALKQTLGGLTAAGQALEALASSLEGARGEVSALGEVASGAAGRLDEGAAETLEAQRSLAENAQASGAATLEKFEATAAALAEAANRQIAEQVRVARAASDGIAVAGREQRERSERAEQAIRTSVGALSTSLETVRANIASLSLAAAGASSQMEAQGKRMVETLKHLEDNLRQGLNDANAAGRALQDLGVASVAAAASLREGMETELSRWEAFTERFRWLRRR